MRAEHTPTAGICTAGSEISLIMLRVGASHPGHIYGLGIYTQGSIYGVSRARSVYIYVPTVPDNGGGA